MKIKLILLNTILFSVLHGQILTKRALFLGNSYTSVNNLPQLVADVAASAGDTLIIDSNTPGGYTLQNHSVNSSSLAKIALGNWDYVVLQEQSQLPSFPDSQVEAEVFPYAHLLDSIINSENNCAETVFYMTWGRKNGDASNCSFWPPVCSYSGMDSLLNLRYRMMADTNNGIVSPVGAVWYYLRQNFPLIELYQSDDSHPSVAGSYAAACTFYSIFFRKDPTLITFNAILSESDASTIRTVAKSIVFDSLINWHVAEYDPKANFTDSVSEGGQLVLTNNSAYASEYFWDFGDGTTSTATAPTHTYTTNGTFNINLVASHCGFTDTVSKTITISLSELQEDNFDSNDLKSYPNPTSNELNLIVNSKFIGSQFVIYDKLGKSVLTGRLDSENTLISLQELAKGFYLVCFGEQLEHTIKVIKN
jgi:PKD repeat protein